jgi:hypothetical protein
MLHCRTNDEWYKAEELLENLRKYTDATGVAGDFGSTNFYSMTGSPVANGPDR